MGATISLRGCRNLATLGLAQLLMLATGVRADFSITEIKPLATGTISRAYGVNNQGVVVGESNTAFSTFMQAIRTDDQGNTQSLGVLPGASTRALGVSEGGVVVGRSLSSTPGGPVSHAFVAVDPQSGIQMLPGLSGTVSSTATGVAGGTIVGTVIDAAGNSQAVTWDLQGNIKPVGGLVNQGNSTAVGVNAAGQVTGSATTSLAVEHAFRFTPGENGKPDDMKDLGSLALGGASQGNDINSNGQVTGWTSTDSGNHHAFAYLSDTMIDLQGNLFVGSSSEGHAINSVGWVVGDLQGANGSSSAFLWKSGTGMVDLNTLIDKSLGWTLLSATGINDHGQISGYGILNGQIRGFLLTPRFSPVPEPSSLALASLGGAGALIVVSRRRRLRSPTAEGPR